MELKYSGKVSEGILSIVNRSAMDRELSLFEGKEVEIIIRKKKKVRSLALNSYYWAEVVPKIQAGLRQTGEQLNLSQTDQWLRDFFQCVTKEQAHEYLKEKFIDDMDINEETGEITKKKRLTTTNMSTSQFQDYIAQCVQLGAEHLGVQILMPNEQSEADFNL